MKITEKDINRSLGSGRKRRHIDEWILAEARKDLNVFAQLMLGIKPAKHHRIINEQLHRIASYELDRLMLFMPPGHAKSTYASHLFPAWYLGNNPDKNIIGCSHTTQFAETWGRKVRNLFSENGWPFPDIKIRSDSKAAGNWTTTKNGEYFAVGTGAAVTGRRGDGAIIDDPIKGREDAESETIREKVWDWFRSDLRTRLKPNGWIIIIQTRWHEDDLSGRILGPTYQGESGDIRGIDGDTWHVISLPALAESNDALGRKPGEALWPEFYSAERLLAEKHAQGEYNWASLYQQRPSPEQGEFFKRDWIRWYTETPAKSTLRLYGASDYAVTAGGGDYTVHGIVGIDANDDMYILDLWRGRVDSAEAVDQWSHMATEWRPVQWGEDKAQIEKTLGPFIDKRQKEQGIYCHREQLPVTSDKAMRAQAFRGRLSQGKVYFPANAPWIQDLVSELMIFPNGKHDDQVDVLSIFGRMLSQMRPNRPIQHINVIGSAPRRVVSMRRAK